MDYDDRNKNVVGKYRLGVVLGTGDFDCTIRTCTHVVTGQQFAIRVYSKAVLAEKGSWQQLADAVQVVRTLPRSERIVETVECFETSSYLYILMAFAQGISLYKLLVLGPSQYKPTTATITAAGATSGSSTSGANNNNTTTLSAATTNSNNNNASSSTASGELNLNLNDKRIIFMQVLQGLQHLHSHDVAHMSLAPDHILIHWDRGGGSGASSSGSSGTTVQSATKFSVRIGFLVACKKVDPGQKMRHLCGTNHTIAPEVLRQTEAYDPFLADIWSAGVVWYFMLSGGKYPFDGANTSKHILSHDVRPLDPAIPAEARELVHHMMNPDPSRRLSLAQVLDHAWLNNKSQVSSKHMQSVIQNAVTAKRDEASGKIIVRVMPLMFPKKELAARVIQAVWRLVRYRPSANRGHHKKKGGGGKDSAGGGKKNRRKKGDLPKLDDAWGAAVESGSDLGDDSDESDSDDIEDEDVDDDDDEEDEDYDYFIAPNGQRKRRRKRAADDDDGQFKHRLKMIRNQQKSTVPKMPTSLIAHDVRCTHCGRVPPTTFQSGKHPFPQSHFHYQSTVGFQDREELIRQHQQMQHQEFLEQQEQQQQQLQLMMMAQQQQQDGTHHYVLDPASAPHHHQHTSSGSFILQTPPAFSLSTGYGGTVSLPQSRQGSYHHHRRPSSASNSLGAFGGLSPRPPSSGQRQQQQQFGRRIGSGSGRRGTTASNTTSVNNIHSSLVTPNPYQQNFAEVAQTTSVNPMTQTLFPYGNNVGSDRNNFAYPGASERRMTSELGISGFMDQPALAAMSKGERAFAGKLTPSLPPSNQGSKMHLFSGNSSMAVRSPNSNSNNNVLSSHLSGSSGLPTNMNVMNHHHNNDNSTLLSSSSASASLTLEQRREIFRRQQQEERRFISSGSRALSGSSGNHSSSNNNNQSSQEDVMVHSMMMYQNIQNRQLATQSSSSGSGSGGRNTNTTTNRTGTGGGLSSGQPSFIQTKNSNYNYNNSSFAPSPSSNNPSRRVSSGGAGVGGGLRQQNHHPSMNPLPPLARGFSTMSSASGGASGGGVNSQQGFYSMPSAIQESQAFHQYYQQQQQQQQQQQMYYQQQQIGSGSGSGSGSGGRSGYSSASSMARQNSSGSGGVGVGGGLTSASSQGAMSMKSNASSGSHGGGGLIQVMTGLSGRSVASSMSGGDDSSNPLAQFSNNPQLMYQNLQHQGSGGGSSSNNFYYGQSSTNVPPPPPQGMNATMHYVPTPAHSVNAYPPHVQQQQQQEQQFYPNDNKMAEPLKSKAETASQQGSSSNNMITDGDGQHNHSGLLPHVPPPSGKRKTLPNIHRVESYDEVEKVDSFVDDGGDEDDEGVANSPTHQHRHHHHHQRRNGVENDDEEEESHDEATPRVEPL